MAPGITQCGTRVCRRVRQNRPNCSLPCKGVPHGRVAQEPWGTRRKTARLVSPRLHSMK
jgi:hypothetical protein